MTGSFNNRDLAIAVPHSACPPQPEQYSWSCSKRFILCALPRAADVSAIDIDCHPVPTKTNPLGVKGAGEAGSVGPNSTSPRGETALLHIGDHRLQVEHALGIAAEDIALRLFREERQIIDRRR
jgi:hypothetical protein